MTPGNTESKASWCKNVIRNLEGKGFILQMWQMQTPAGENPTLSFNHNCT